MCWNSVNCQFDVSVLNMGCICVLSDILYACAPPNLMAHDISAVCCAVKPIFELSMDV